MQVFISVQRIRNQQQEFMLGIVLESLQHAGATPLILNRDANEAFTDPMLRIREALTSCDAAIVIAFARTAASEVVEYPDDPYAISHPSLRFSSVWNQIEAAMAFQAGLPLIVFQNDDLFQQGAINIRRTSYSVVTLTVDSDQASLRRHVTRAIIPWLQSIASS